MSYGFPPTPPQSLCRGCRATHAGKFSGDCRLAFEFVLQTLDGAFQGFHFGGFLYRNCFKGFDDTLKDSLFFLKVVVAVSVLVKPVNSIFFMATNCFLTASSSSSPIGYTPYSLLIRPPQKAGDSNPVSFQPSPFRCFFNAKGLSGKGKPAPVPSISGLLAVVLLCLWKKEKILMPTSIYNHTPQFKCISEK
ncbi:MAG: hypothetical protein LBK73_16620 [Treponema sp.]|jgi:hypothetical protein|nr:hypothetical protein [Treponema sp.]